MSAWSRGGGRVADPSHDHVDQAGAEPDARHDPRRSHSATDSTGELHRAAIPLSSVLLALAVLAASSLVVLRLTRSTATTGESDSRSAVTPVGPDADGRAWCSTSCRV